MDGHEIAVYDGLRSAPASPREVLQILFRHRRLILVAFFATLTGALIATVLFGIKYKAETTILVRDNRQNDVVSGSPNQPQVMPDDLSREREIDTEVALLKSRDLLEQVVRESNLLPTSRHFWSRWLARWESPSTEMSKEVRKLRKALDVAPVPDSNIIEVSYSSRDPNQAVTVLRNLDKFYIAKHIAVNRPPDVVNFFTQQTQLYLNKLDDAEKQLADFDLTQDSAAPDLEKEIVVRKRSEFEAELRATQVAIAGTQQRDRALEAEMSVTPSRLSTKQTLSDNGQLMANLKSTLQQLEDQRTVLLSNYQPSYRPVQDVEKQIAQVKAAIATAQKAPLRETTTDQNPTYEMLQDELEKSKADLVALGRKAAALSPVVQAYGQAALVSDKQSIARQNLLRSVSVAKQNYLLYLGKMEQARISQALDNQRILNVVVAENPTVPALPTISPLLLLLAGTILAVMISLGAAFVADYFDPTLRTPDEVLRYLDLPVLAALPMSSGPVQFALPSGSDAPSLGSDTPKSAKNRSLFWHDGNSN